MDHNFNFNKQISSSKCFCGILYILIAMLLSQLFAVLLSEALLSMGIGGAMCNIISGILYVIFTLAATAGMCCLFKTHLSEMRITPLKIKPIWLASAFIIPLLTIGGFLLAGGFWETNIRSSETSLMIITAAVAFYGIGAGIVEEIVFRGIIMSCLERRFNIRAAIIAPSILFGALHIIGNDLKPLSAIQLLAAGSIVGIMFSLIVYESGSVWNSAVIHVIWNIMIAGGILHIGSGARVDSLFNFTLNSRSSLITGGDFGAEASVIAIAVYLIFCALAIFLKSGARRGRLA